MKKSILLVGAIFLMSSIGFNYAVLGEPAKSEPNICNVVNHKTGNPFVARWDFKLNNEVIMQASDYWSLARAGMEYEKAGKCIYVGERHKEKPKCVKDRDSSAPFSTNDIDLDSLED